MIKKYCFLSIIILILFFKIAFAENNQFKTDINNFYEKTKILINDFLKNRNVKNIKNIKLSNWTGKEGSLKPSDFTSEEKKNEIKQTLTINVELEFSSGLYGRIRMARFQTQENAIIAYRDSGPSSTALSYLSLFSGKKIKDAHVLSQNIYNNMIISYLIYKGCSFKIALGRSKSEKYLKLKKEDFDFADNIILNIKDLIDKSIK